MESKDLRKLMNMGKVPFKVTGSVATANGSTLTYYVKPSVKCKLLLGRLHIVTAAGAALSAPGGITKETAVNDPDLLPDTVTISTNITAGTAVDNDALLSVATAGVGSVGVYNMVPAANHAGTANIFDPALNDALLLTLPGGSHATVMAATLELEFIPV